MSKRLSLHHCAGSKRCTFRMYLSLNGLSGSIKTPNCSPCFGVDLSLYTWCPLIKVSRSKVVIKTIGSSSCKQIISVLILKTNIPIHNVQTCNDRFFLSHKIIQWNGVIAFSKHYSNVLIRIFLWMKVFTCWKLFTEFL